MRSRENFSINSQGIAKEKEDINAEALEMERQNIKEGLEEFEEEVERLSFIFGQVEILKGECKEDGGENIMFFIAHPESTRRDNKFIVLQTKDKMNLIFVSTPRKIHALHQDMFEALQRHVEELECIGGGEMKLDPVRLYGSSSDYGKVSRQIIEKVKRVIENEIERSKLPVLE